MIKSLRLTNFKGFREATVPLGPLTLLVGANASGKSNAREALQFLQGCALGYSLAEIIGEKWGHGVLLWRGPRGGANEIAYRGGKKFGLEVDFAPAGEADWPGSYSIDVVTENPLGKISPQVTREEMRLQLGVDGESGGFTALDDIREEGILVQPLVASPEEASGWGQFYSRSHPVLGQVLDKKGCEYSMHAASMLTISTLEDMRFLDLVPRVMRKASLPGQVLGDQGENLSSALLKIVEDPQRKDAILDWLRALTPMDVQDLHFKEDLQRRVLVYLVEASGLEVSADSASDGTLRFLALMAAVLSSVGGSFFFFEEIDNGIHPTRLHVLLDVLEQASRQMGHQIVATTHNPQLVAFLSEKARQDAVLLYRREQSQTADAIPIMELPDIGRVLETQDLGHLFASGWLEDVVECLADEEEEPRAVPASGS